ncbi:MAG: metalloregulator ArsR/SmtB family transcription factor [Deltaproteobacteria bacterium]|nr:metalloregulator ArsR/SmtB family transcription factor [Deltaproteobacteria bacterium]
MFTNKNQRDLAQAYYPELARIGKAIASSTRLEILDLLRQGPRCVDEIAEELELTAANTSQHLRQLLQTHLVAREKEAQRVYYRVANDDVCRFFFALQTVADKQLAEVSEIRRDVLDMQDGTTIEDLARMARSGEAVVVDVRPSTEYDAGHMLGALSMPLPEISGRIDEFPADRDVVVYCRGLYCTLALEAVKTLRENGLQAHRLPLGIIEMRSRHWRIERCGASGLPGSPRRRKLPNVLKKEQEPYDSSIYICSTRCDACLICRFCN